MTGYGFDRDAEYSAWLRQSQALPRSCPLGGGYELHAEHSATWTTQQFPEHKAVLLPPQSAQALPAHRRLPASPAGLRARGCPTQAGAVLPWETMRVTGRPLGRPARAGRKDTNQHSVAISLWSS